MSHELPRRAFLPVIHVQNHAQALRNIAIAFDNGAHGVFLINHDISAERLLAIYHSMRTLFPNQWIGLNCLDLGPERMLTIVPPDVSGIWVDSVNIHLRDPDPVRSARRYHEIRKEPNHRWKGLFFGGVAFKGQPDSGDAAEEARLAAPFVDVVTTSGPATGSAPSVTKIRTMREATPPQKPLAIASGMTPKNVGKFYAFANYFLVASGISHSHTELNPTLVRAFADVFEPKD